MQKEINDITGIFIVKRGYENTVELINKSTNYQEVVDYFAFKKKLPTYFDQSTVNKILDHINCYRRLLIDFDKKIARLITEKDYDFSKAINAYMTPQAVENDLLDPTLSEDEIYSKFQQL